MKSTSLFFALAAALTACATAPSTDDGIGGSSGTSQSSTSEATTTAMSSSSTGGCAQDCSTVDVPACYESVCNMSTQQCEVKQQSNGSDCDDGKFCTENEKCHNGICGQGTEKICEQTDPCQTFACDADTDTCVGTPAAEQSHCDSGNVCDIYGLCISGACLGVPKNCGSLTDQCNTGTCDTTSGDCVAMPTNEGNACTGGSFCETNKVCTAGVCMGNSAGLTEVMVSGTGLPLTIPDGPATGVTNTVNVAQTGNVVALAIEMDISHGYDGDVVVKLDPPVGSPVVLTQNFGGSNDNYTGTVFSTSATTPIATGAPPFTGEFTPVGSFTPILGTSVTGNWGLNAIDDGAGVTGTLDAWTLHACVQ